MKKDLKNIDDLIYIRKEIREYSGKYKNKIIIFLITWTILFSSILNLILIAYEKLQKVKILKLISISIPLLLIIIN